MNCEKAKSELPLLLYGELEFDTEEAVEQHLESCADCRAELEREKALHHALELTDLTPPPGMLASCRRELFSGVRAGRETSWLRRWFGPWETWLKPAGAVALLVIGFGTARLTSNPTPELSGGSSNDVVVTRVRNVEPNRNGSVQILLEETRQRRVSGSLGDEGVRRLLLTAAEDPSDAGLRVESMELLKGESDETEVRKALLRAVRADSNPGVRLKALDALRPYTRDREVRLALSHVLLNDENAWIRTQAVDLLTQHRENEMVGTLQELMRHENNDYIRQRTQRVLREMNASVDTY